MKEFLSRNRVEFTPRLLTDETHRLEVERRGAGPAPLTLIGDAAVSGFEPARLRSALERAGLLEPGASPRDAAAGERVASLEVALAGSVAVAGFLDDSVAFLDAAAGTPLAGALSRSTVALPGHPIALEPCARAGVLAVVCYEAGCVTFLSLDDAAPAAGTLAASTLATGSLPLYAVAHPSLPRLYVSGSESRDLTVLDPSKLDYAFGSRERSSFALPGQPGVMALDLAGEVLYVRLREGAVVRLRADDLRPLHGTLEASTFRCGRGRGIALGDAGRRVLVPEALEGADGLGVYDARTGAPDRAGGRPAPRPCAAVPFAIVAHPRRPIAYVSCFGPQVVELRDARTGDFLHGSVAASSFPVGGGARAMLVDAAHELLCVSCFDDGEVRLLDATSGEARGSIAVGAGPRGLALL